MIVELKSVKLVTEGNRLKIMRSSSFRFWQWLSFFIIIVVVLSVTYFLYSLNKEKVNLILLSGEYEQVVILIGILVIGGVLLCYLYLITRKSTKPYEIVLANSEVLINSKLIGSLTQLKEVIVIRNVGWRGLGLRYTIGLLADNRRLPLVYSLDNKEAKEVFDLIQNFLTSHDFYDFTKL